MVRVYSNVCIFPSSFVLPSDPKGIPMRMLPMLPWRLFGSGYRQTAMLTGYALTRPGEKVNSTAPVLLQIDRIIFCVFLEKDCYIYRSLLPVYFPLGSQVEGWA